MVETDVPVLGARRHQRVGAVQKARDVIGGDIEGRCPVPYDGSGKWIADERTRCCRSKNLSKKV
ncbi:hypothetical protein ACH41H_29480 [Streptomyces sp. NPDC020800]|uniref:hypothetical protein n=1 Tax=Streptomyces sp. NPDC020800 TaxID=3365092 RepID=UPI00378F97FD